jgi:hypothetical protein
VSPFVTSATITVGQSAAGSILEVRGLRFGRDKMKISAKLAVGMSTLTYDPKPLLCTETLLLLSLGSTKHIPIATPIMASLQHSETGSSNTAEVAKIASGIAATPYLAGQSSRFLATTATSVTVSGSDLGALADARLYFGFSDSHLHFACPNLALTAAELTCTGILFNATAGTKLYATATVNGVKSNVAELATFVTGAHVHTADFKVERNTGTSRVEISGTSFGSDCSELSVAFVPALTAYPVMCSSNQLVVDTASTSSLALGDLKAVVTRSGGESNGGTAVKIGSVIASAGSAPSITASTEAFSYKETTLSIAGSNFGNTGSDVRIYLLPANGDPPTAAVMTGSPSLLSANIGIMTTMHQGIMQATVTRGGVQSSIASVATVKEIYPVISSIAPRSSPVEGGVIVTIIGKHLSYHKLWCGWGSPTANSTVVGNDTLATCVTPPIAAGNVSLKIHIQDGRSVSTAVNVVFYPSVLVSDTKHHRVLRFNADTGDFAGVFVTPSSGGLTRPQGLAFGSGRRFFVASEGTRSILQYDASTGVFVKEFCRTSGAPKGITVHYTDLYVCGGSDAKIHRFNGLTGAYRGVYAGSPNLKYPWSVIFDRHTNASLVADMQQHHLVHFTQPKFDAKANLALGDFQATHRRQWSFNKITQVRTMDVTEDSLYVTSPALGFAAAQYNRSTGHHIYNIEDSNVQQPSDVKVYGNYLYVCGKGEIRKYNRYDGELLGVFAKENMACGFMIFHIN